MITGQPVNGHYRVLVLKWYWDMKLSETTCHRISKLIGECEKDERENMAKRILELTDDCKTEEEILQKLKDIIK